jgi:hypothetical protein
MADCKFESCCSPVNWFRAPTMREASRPRAAAAGPSLDADRTLRSLALGCLEYCTDGLGAFTSAADTIASCRAVRSQTEAQAHASYAAQRATDRAAVHTA